MVIEIRKVCAIMLCLSAFSFADVAIGTRLGVGVSALRGHKAQTSPSFVGGKGIQFGPALSFSAGVAASISMSDLISIAPELQYTLYRSNGEYSAESGSIPDFNESGVNLHVLELPILARFNLGTIYAEVGPQVGFNFRSTLYRNSEYYAPDLNLIAFGPSAGFGVNMNGLLLGVRGHFGLFEYAENTKGYPWAVQASVTKFFF